MKCNCGNTFVQYSTLVSICPSCQIKALQQKKQSNIEKYSFIIGKHHSGAKTKQKRQKSDFIKAKEKAWLWFSRFIRLNHSINGACKCYTCGSVHDIKKMDAGHFITRSKTAVFLNENNCRPQCMGCNRFQQGRSYDFEQHLIEEIGKEEVENLKELAKIEVHRTEQDYLEIAETYRINVKQLQKEFGVKIW